MFLYGTCTYCFVDHMNSETVKLFQFFMGICYYVMHSRTHLGHTHANLMCDTSLAPWHHFYSKPTHLCHLYLCIHHLIFQPVCRVVWWSHLMLLPTQVPQPRLQLKSDVLETGNVELDLIQNHNNPFKGAFTKFPCEFLGIHRKGADFHQRADIMKFLMI